MAVEEILVHISSNKDDEHYKRLSKAYDAFAVDRRTNLNGEMRTRRRSRIAATPEEHNEAEHDEASPEPALPALREAYFEQDTALAAAAIESQLLTSSLVEANLRNNKPKPGGSVDAIEIPSTPEHPQSPSRLLPERQALPPAPIPTPPAQTSSPRPPESTAQAAGTKPSGTVPSSSPAAIYTSTKPGGKKNRRSHRRRGVHDTVHILAPLAPVGYLEASASHMTPELAELAQRLPLATHYEPVARVARELDRLERGYWLVETRAWPDGLAEKLWTYLADFVGRGDAGWAVSCWREDAPAAEVSTIGTAVKVYCYGEVVPHVYLVLYTGSESKVKRTGAQWMDADGHAVVRISSD